MALSAIYPPRKCRRRRPAERKRTARDDHRSIAARVLRNTERGAYSSTATRPRIHRARAESLRGRPTTRHGASALQTELAPTNAGYTERQGAAEERSGALARRDADLKTTRAGVARLAQDLSGARPALPAGGHASRSARRAVASIAIRNWQGAGCRCRTSICAASRVKLEEEPDPRIARHCSNAWATST